MKTKPLVMLCWVQVVLAAVMVLLNFTSQITRPWSGFNYSRATGIVSDVIPGSPADRAGLKLGDRIVTWNGHAVGRDVNPLFFASANKALPLVVERRYRSSSNATAERMI
jgi:S1-C subfamily serine protease